MNAKRFALFLFALVIIGGGIFVFHTPTPALVRPKVVPPSPSQKPTPTPAPVKLPPEKPEKRINYIMPFYNPKDGKDELAYMQLFFVGLPVSKENDMDRLRTLIDMQMIGAEKLSGEMLHAQAFRTIRWYIMEISRSGAEAVILEFPRRGYSMYLYRESKR